MGIYLGDLRSPRLLTTYIHRDDPPSTRWIFLLNNFTPKELAGFCHSRLRSYSYRIGSWEILSHHLEGLRTYTGWWVFKYIVLIFLGLRGEMIQVDQYFSNGLVQPLTSIFIGIIIHLLPSYQVPVSGCPSMVVQSWESRGNTIVPVLPRLTTYLELEGQPDLNGWRFGDDSNHFSMVKIWSPHPITKSFRYLRWRYWTL